ncbi:MAG: glycosyltransferase family 2 protein [Bacteroidia bacterium]|nr:glycosyltransferase family 2 protein [Bacteroidia bacterium]
MISIIIICKNEVAYIQQTIDAALQQQTSGEKLEVIVVDGMSSDGTYELVANIYKNKVSLLRNEKMIAPVGMNIGIKAAKGEYIAICGARSILNNTYLENCILILNKSSAIKCVGGLIKQTGINSISNNIAIAMSSLFGVGLTNFRTLRTSGFVDTVSVPVFPRQLFDEVGTFDESCIRNQDDDFSFRIHKANYKIWITDQATSTYIVRSSFNTFFKQYLQYGFWKVFVNYKHQRITSFRQLIPPFFILLLFFSSMINPLLFCGISTIYLLSILSISIYYSLFKRGNIFYLFYSFLILHFSYGWGYLIGLFNIIILNKTIPEYMRTISR